MKSMFEGGGHETVLMASLALCLFHDIVCSFHDFVQSVVRYLMMSFVLAMVSLGLASSFRESFRSFVLTFVSPFVRRFVRSSFPALFRPFILAFVRPSFSVFFSLSGRAARKPPGPDSGGRVQLQEVQVSQAVSAASCRTVPCLTLRCVAGYWPDIAGHYILPCRVMHAAVLLQVAHCYL